MSQSMVYSTYEQTNEPVRFLRQAGASADEEKRISGTNQPHHSVGRVDHTHSVVRNNKRKKIRYQINRRPSQIKKLSKSSQYKAKKREHAKSSVRAKVEHIFGVVKGLLKFKKTRYRGLRKQAAKFNIMFALANLILADRPCLAA